LLLDDTGFAKQGKASVGVARQYSGTLGQVGNSQVAVTCCYSDPLALWPVGVRLYLPEAWPQDLGRCRQAGIPPEVGFQTKPEIALALLDQARSWGVPHHCVVADADYGDNPNSLAGLEAPGEPYVVGVRADFGVSLATQAPGRRADRVLAALPRSLWGTIPWRQGSQGWLRKKFVALYCWRHTRDGAVGEGWLLGERPARGQPGEYKYYWSNLPATTPLEKLVEYGHRRHAIEQFHEEAKGELG
jgi:SRSO17 transposase